VTSTAKTILVIVAAILLIFLISLIFLGIGSG
jgi:hypothetical protein